MVNGPGVWVRRVGCTYPVLLKFLVSRRSEVGLAVLTSADIGGLAVLGEQFSMAAAYAFESVLKAVGEDGSTSDFNAVEDFPKVTAAAGVLI